MSNKITLYSPTGYLINTIKWINVKFFVLLKVKGFLTTQINGWESRKKYYRKPFAKKIKLVSYKLHYKVMYRLPEIVRILTFN